MSGTVPLANDEAFQRALSSSVAVTARHPATCLSKATAESQTKQLHAAQCGSATLARRRQKKTLPCIRPE